MTKLIPLALTLFLVACTTSPSYGPRETPGGFGFADQKIETGRYRVTYRARNAAAAENGALRRAAELAIAEGFSNFTVVSRDLETTRDRSRSSVGIGGGTGGRRSGVGVGVSLPLGGGSEEVAINLQVVMGNGERSGDPRQYDARETLSNLSMNAPL